jgi:hypothetical protein
VRTLAGVLCGMLLGCLAPVPVGAQANKVSGPLKIVDVWFEDYEGFAVPRLELKAGSEAVLSFRVEGFERDEGKDAAGYPQAGIHLEYEVEMRDPGGVLVAPPKKDRILQILGPQDDQWRPKVRWSALIPPTAPSGNYPILIHVKDSVGDQQAEAKAILQVRGEAVPAADALTAARLEFARSPDGPWSSTRYFSRQDPIYVRFRVVGFHVAPDHRVSVEQDWSVLDGEGHVIVHRENAVEDQQKEFYSPRFLTTSFRVELEKPMPGSYTLHLDLRDRVGGQAVSLDAPFNLRP